MEAASSAYESAAERANAAAERVHRRKNKIDQSVGQVRENLSGAGRSVMDFPNEQPLVLSGLGVVIGAVMGAALPTTAAENELMGEKSDALKDQIAKIAGEQLYKGKDVAERAWRDATEESTTQDLMTSTDGADHERDLQNVQASRGAVAIARGAECLMKKRRWSPRLTNLKPPRRHAAGRSAIGLGAPRWECRVCVTVAPQSRPASPSTMRDQCTSY
jgi:hypothetical protein